MKGLYKIYLFCICMLALFQVQAQQAFISVDTTSAMVGEPILLQLKVSSGSELNWPGWEKGISGFEVLEAGELQSNKANGAITYMQSLRLTRFDTGTFHLGPVGFLVGQDSLFSQVIDIHYSTIETKEDEMHDIKAPIAEPYTLEEFLMEIIIGCVLIILIVLAVYFIVRAKKKKGEKAAPVRKRQAVHILAMKALKELKAQELWQKGEMKAYYVRLTDILRAYIEERYNIKALESTTDEIVEGLKSKSVDKVLVERMEEILKIADMVKFAKSNPVGIDNDKCLADIMVFVDQTKKVATTNQQK